MAAAGRLIADAPPPADPVASGETPRRVSCPRRANDQAVAYVYSRATEAEALQAKVLTADERGGSPSTLQGCRRCCSERRGRKAATVRSCVPNGALRAIGRRPAAINSGGSPCVGRRPQVGADQVGGAQVGVQDYVIGGMDPDFRELLFQAGNAMDAAGIAWTVLSGFRDDYRPALPAVWMALFTTAPTSDAGTGGTEVSGTSYARVQVAGTGARGKQRRSRTRPRAGCAATS
jgi:hypothetical protein